jgi:predicted dehydrogenase
VGVRRVHADHAIAAARRACTCSSKTDRRHLGAGRRAGAEASRAGVTLGVIFQDRFKPDVVRLKSFVTRPAGKPILATASVKWYRPPSYYATSDWRGTRALDGGGALINQGVHTVDLLLWLFGPVRRVPEGSRRNAQIEVEDTAVAVLEFANGASGRSRRPRPRIPAIAPRRIDGLERHRDPRR